MARIAPLTERLEAELRARGHFESQAGNRMRAIVIAEIEAIVRDVCARATTASDNVAPVLGASSAAAAANARLLVFGSYREGVHSSTSDCDVLALCPGSVTLATFFSLLPPVLRGLDGLEFLQPVPDAFVPVIKLTVKGVAIDLLFARWPRAAPPPPPNDVEWWRSSDADALASALLAADPKSVLAINGVRVTEAIVYAVTGRNVGELHKPVPEVHPGSLAHTFRLSLITIKTWARSRGIYGHAFGYLGGVNWAILVAYACKETQSSPAASRSHHDPWRVVARVLTILCDHPWPAPIVLDPKIPLPVSLSRADYRAASAMPIVTPVRPSQDSAYNVTRATLRIMQDEARRALRILQDAGIGDHPVAAAPGSAPPLPQRIATAMSLLLEPSQFLQRYAHVMRVTITAGVTKPPVQEASAISVDTAAQAEAWFGFVESKLRLLPTAVVAASERWPPLPSANGQLRRLRVVAHLHPVRWAGPTWATVQPAHSGNTSPSNSSSGSNSINYFVGIAFDVDGGADDAAATATADLTTAIASWTAIIERSPVRRATCDSIAVSLMTRQQVLSWVGRERISSEPITAPLPLTMPLTTDSPMRKAAAVRRAAAKRTVNALGDEYNSPAKKSRAADSTKRDT